MKKVTFVNSLMHNHIYVRCIFFSNFGVFILDSVSHSVMTLVSHDVVSYSVVTVMRHWILYIATCALFQYCHMTHNIYLKNAYCIVLLVPSHTY